MSKDIYIVIDSDNCTSSEQFYSKVNRKIQSGYIPYGSLCSINTTHSGRLYQAMILKEHLPNIKKDNFNF